MTIARRRFLKFAVSAVAMPAVARLARADTYPSRPVHFIVPQAAASASDIVARLIGDFLSNRLGQQFVVDDRPGAGGNVGTEAVVRATPDGYTLLLCNSQNAISAALYPELTFNFIRDTVAVGQVESVPLVMEVHPSVPAKTVQEFIAYAKANPGKINMASPGIGSTPPCQRRAVQGDDRHQYGARSVSQRGGGDDRPAERTSPTLLRHHSIVARICQNRQTARAGGDHRAALECIAGHSGRRRIRTGLRS